MPAGLYVLGLVQEAVPHVEPEAANWQAPAPLHPMNPQGLVASFGHSLSGSLVGGTGAHLPSAWPVLAFAQAKHLPSHLASQQTVSTQKLDWHSFGRLLQCAPAGFFGAHVVPAQ
jgi:hypothetical protein